MTLSEAEQRIVKEVYGVPYDDLGYTQQDIIDGVLEDMPDAVLEIINGDHFTGDDVQDAMNEVFETMEDQDDFSEEKLNGAAIFAKEWRNDLDSNGPCHGRGSIHILHT
jgi:hypothetical protein